MNDQIIQHLADALNGNDKAQEWLQRQGKQELIMVHDVLRYDDDNAMEWLHDYGHDNWALFITAVDGDPHAVQALFDGKQSRLAMCAGSVLGDQKAIDFLQKNGLKAWQNLAAAVKKVLSEE
ncbi:MAG TPA: hypothetical protein VL651_05100 [Bacteroidia bacterium]|jgi:hypothetical protein|nr:hypothetical protein [Bacteroidia bacterium]